MTNYYEELKLDKALSANELQDNLIRLESTCYMSKDGDFKAFVSSESASQLIISALKSIGNGIELSSQTVYYVGNLFADAARQR